MDRNGNKTGGRKKGTPNKTSAMTKAGLASLLGAYEESGLLQKDFMSLKPKDRIFMAKELYPFLLPKMQAVAVDAEVNERQKSAADKLIELSKLPEGE